MSATSTLHDSGGHRRRRRLTTLVGLLATGSLLVAACGGGDDDDGDESDGDGDTTTTSAEEVGTATTQAPTTTAAATTTTTPAEFEYVTEGAVVVVANASRINGAAGRMTERLDAVGYTTAEATNSSDDVGSLETTEISYVAGDAAAQAVAENLRLAFGGGDITVEEVGDPAPTESGELGEATVLVLMGNDIADRTLEELQDPGAAADTGGDGDEDGGGETTTTVADGGGETTTTVADGGETTTTVADGGEETTTTVADGGDA